MDGQASAPGARWLNTEWVDADVRITTGFVEPHFFAGFSGGPKMVAPGLAGLETVLTLHDAARIGSPHARWGVTEGNPIHDDVRAIAAATGHRLRARRLAGQGAADRGGLRRRAPRRCIVEACRAAGPIAMRPVAEPFDVVVTSNSGFPLDQNLYQALTTEGPTIRRLR